jgi:beta-lactamase class A
VRFVFLAILAMLSSLQPAASLSTEFAAIAATAEGQVGVHAEVIETGDAAALNDGERFPMQSVYKLPISMAVLDQVDQKTITLGEKVYLGANDMAPPGLHSPLRDVHPRGGVDVSVRDLIRAAIVESDGTASDVLLKLAGGPARATAYLRGLGITAMTIATTEKEMAKDPMAQYRNFSTPRAAVALLKALHTVRTLSPASRELLVQDLIDSGPGPKRLKGLLPANTTVAHKTGTDATRNGLTRATNDIGIVTLPNGRHLAIAVFIKDSTADETTREATIARIAQAAWHHWTAAK